MAEWNKSLFDKVNEILDGYDKDDNDIIYQDVEEIAVYLTENEDELSNEQADNLLQYIRYWRKENGIS